MFTNSNIHAHTQRQAPLTRQASTVEQVAVPPGVIVAA
jgi:hypothetical protein